MGYEVTWGDELATRITSQFGPERTPEGHPSSYDFVAGPLAAAVQLFQDFDSLPEAAGPAVRSAHMVDGVLGVVVFIGIVLTAGRVEIVDVEVDLDYWDQVGDDPDGSA